jgi:hypothetical protein
MEMPVPRSEVTIAVAGTPPVSPIVMHYRVANSPVILLLPSSWPA